MRKAVWPALLIIGAAIAAAFYLSAQAGGRALAFTLLLGLALGVALQRTRFCFLCHARDWHDKDDARGLLAILLALAVGSIGYTIILGSWLPVPERLPPDAHIGPVSWALVLAGIARLFEGRWPYWTGGVIVGLIAVFIIVRTKPLGVTSALGSLARRIGETYAVVPLRLEGLDGFGGCATVIQDTLLTPNGVLVLALIAGSFASALASGQFTPRLPTLGDASRGLIGGTLLGWGSMTGLGCTIGTLLSGVSAGALSGWVFGASMFAAVWVGFKLQALLQR